MNTKNYIKKIFQISTEAEFNLAALELFNYQYKYNTIYHQYVNMLSNNIKEIKQYSQIPFLPIDFFKSHDVIIKDTKPKAVFYSSGTTNNKKSKHYVVDLNIYKKSIISSFKLLIGDPKKFSILCLVPTLQNKPNSSLAYMCNELINLSGNEFSGFYISKKQELKSVIQKCEEIGQKFILFGLSSEILKFSKDNNALFKNGIIIETGGNKIHGEHIIREELHNRLAKKFGKDKIYSEYGMAELLSQSYYVNNNGFVCPPWKKILIRDKNNPLKILKTPQRGCINIIDLANIYSCGFIATNDAGNLKKNSFNIIGRIKNSTERGCNLMV